MNTRWSRVGILMIAVAVVVGGCANTSSASAPASPTAAGSAAPNTSSSAPCMAALIHGQLVEDSGPGVSLKTEGGTVNGLIWPPGYSFSTGAKRAVLDPQGNAIAQVGDSVELAGGETGPNNDWQVCPDHIVVTASAAP